VSDIAGIVLKKILENPADALDVWPKLKIYFFNSDYNAIFFAISKYYNKRNKLPSFNDLYIITRDESLVLKIKALELLPIPEDVDLLIAAEALADEYTQEETLNQLFDFVERIPMLDTSEVKKSLSDILIVLDERTQETEEIYRMNEVYTIDKEEIHSRIPLGINNTFDANTGGLSLTELIMLGGARGSGKTIAACNIAVNQYMQGNVGLFFSIEMRYREIFNRFISILSNVNNRHIRNMKCTFEDFMKIAKVRKDMFCDAEEVFDDFLKHKNYEKFEIDLISSKKLKPDNQLIIVDNQMLTLTEIDMNIQKFKSIYGDKLKAVVVDYVNQIQETDIYDWKTQIKLSKALKNIARKHDIVMISPYQIDSSGEARFAKGLLDAADVAAILEVPKGSDYITFNSTKTRNIAPFSFNSPINWDTLAISPEDAIIDPESSDNKKEKTKEAVEDITVPWT